MKPIQIHKNIKVIKQIYYWQIYSLGFSSIVLFLSKVLFKEFNFNSLSCNPEIILLSSAGFKLSYFALSFSFILSSISMHPETLPYGVFASSYFLVTLLFVFYNRKIQVISIEKLRHLMQKNNIFQSIIFSFLF